METIPCIRCGCLYDPNELKCTNCGHANIWKVSNDKIKDKDLLYTLETKVNELIKQVPWEQIVYTVPGSLEKVIEAQSGLIYALKRIQKGSEFIRKGKQNENQKEDQ